MKWLEEGYYTCRAYKRTMQKMLPRSKPLLLLHTMGKVGSSTLSHSLGKSGLKNDYRVMRTHFLTPGGVDYFRQVHEEGFKGWQNMTPRIKSMVSKVRVQGRLISPVIKKPPKVKVVSVVRDPLQTNISGYFQNTGWWKNGLSDLCKNNSDLCISELQQDYLNIYPHEFPQRWFESELEQLFDIDFSQQAILGDRGYGIYSSDRADLLIIKLTHLNECARVAFQEFLGTDDFRIVRANESETKWYREIYKKFQKDVRLPKSYVESVYSSNYSKAFFSAEEIEAMRAQWHSPEY